MTKRKSTKRALLLSALSLLMCVSMLIGSTFAWFTDSVTSAGNKIQAGNLKIDLELLDKETGWNSIKESKTAIFDYDKWEPGYTDVKILKIENEGTLALKWYAKFVSAVALSPLADVIDIYVCPSAEELAYPADRDLTGYAYKGTVADFVNTISETTYGSLAPVGKEGSIAYLGIALKMQETAGNEYQELTLGEFDIQILATQYTYEKDSFDDQYDFEAAKDGIRIEEDGAIYIHTEDDIFLEKVTSDFTGDTFEIPAGVTSIGYGSEAEGGVQVFAANPNIKNVVFPASVRNIGYQAFKGSAVESVTLNEGLTEIGEFAFNGATKLTSFNIPSTVEVIGKRAFRSTAATEVVIPASVTKIADSFRDMPNLATVTIEGNVEIANFAFRDCPSLRNVYLLGDDVTLGGGTTFCNASTNNPNVNNISFYVANDVVASRVKASMGAGNDFYIYIDGKEVTIKNVATIAQFQAALDNAVDGDIINLTADINGDVSFTQKNNVTLVLNGNGKKMDGTIKIVARANTSNAATLDIKNFNFVTTDANRACFISSSESNYYPNNLTISNCTFEGTGANSATTAVSIKSANNFVMEYCKANNVHSLMQNANGGWNYTVKHCEVTNAGRGLSFNSTQGILVEDVKIEASNDKYGIRISAEYNTTATIKDCEISAFCPVVVRRASANYNLVFEGENTMTAANTDGIWCAIGTSEYEANGVMPSAATGRVTVTLNDTGLNAAGVYGEA